MPVCYIAFGSNVEDRLSYILKALELLKDYGSILKVSTLYISKPWGKTDQPEFINGVLEFETKLEPIGLLKVLKEIEQKTGRKPRERWGPREIDLDILLYENHILMLSFLRVPHLYLTERDFFLFPLLELNPNLLHPLRRDRLQTYAEKLENNLKPFACLLPL
ncbi:MAG: 2-amino-4-hydroxy-6-hydroxymethyldihydropteridine diphosphokinase [Aquificaceae bacterium]|jgi:2-amino-4-hydroxy-6-hydroxymethyldihydropteridine diphosphokinase|uniref:2-amino-4-hydroxy-6- hydroxymethyldihydropteridine diphosphokinase n=1 Tax=Hydrogenobacter sp. Uz 6-8 TaxID=3384828 RepID=UPI000F22BF3C|nr:MAG: 2-amino-4-hydroxy-6-hydroxymethyldihydropteridine diphosphokinase [Aquificota bacterium]